MSLFSCEPYIFIVAHSPVLSQVDFVIFLWFFNIFCSLAELVAWERIKGVTRALLEEREMVYYVLYAPHRGGDGPVYGSCLNVPQITGDEPFVRFLLIGIGFLLPTLVGLEGSIPSTYGGVEPSFLEKWLLAGHDDASDQLVNLPLVIPVCEGVSA